MREIIFDTETTGLPVDYNAILTDSAKWPHVIQLSYIVYDTDTKEILEKIGCFLLAHRSE